MGENILLSFLNANDKEKNVRLNDFNNNLLIRKTRAELK